MLNERAQILRKTLVERYISDGQLDIRDKPRRAGADDDPGHEIAEDHRQSQSHCNRCYQADVVLHSADFLRCNGCTADRVSCEGLRYDSC